jgi:L-asparaginase/Glu-tRNA(Gln) amidotransferase subunit D
MADPLVESLQKNKERTGEPLKVLMLNTGGTFSSLPNKQGLLEPIKTEKELKRLIFDGLNLNIFIKRDLLQIKILHLFSVDSSQMTEKHRDEIIKAIHPEYIDVDGMIILHGTDTGADTAKFLHLALPYYDPRPIRKNGTREFNWGKPVIVLSSQIPAVDLLDGKLNYRIDSDGPMNLSLALMLIADGTVGESGIITNNGEVLRGTATEKGAAVAIPPYRTDPGVFPLAKYTALGIRYQPQGFLQKIDEGKTFIPFVISGSSKYEDKVITVFESSHLSILKAYIGIGGDAAQILRTQLPDVVIYVSKGAGNVRSGDYDILKKVEKDGVVTFRVPLPGGRIPPQKIYDVPGHEIPALNMQPQTAKYKAMMTLLLADKVFRIKKTEKVNFIQMMMKSPWANEFLPGR